MSYRPRMQTKVRVKRVELMKIVEGRARKAENEYKRAIEAYPARIAGWQAACVKTLEAALAKAQRGNCDFKLGRVQMPEKPEKPVEGRDLCNLRRMHTTLKIGSDDTVLLSQEDADYYFGPCVL